MEARNRYFIGKAIRLRRWWVSIPKNHLPKVRIQASFILKEEGVKSWFQPELGEIVLISSFLQSFTGEPARDVSYELNKGISC